MEKVPKAWPVGCDQPKACRAVILGTASTTMGWIGPAVDRDGNVYRSGNPNKALTTWQCQTCGRAWTEEQADKAQR